MSLSEDAALHLVGMVYDAALDERKWPTFLEAFARAVGGCSSMLRSTDLHTGTASFVASVGYDPAWQSAYCNHFVKLDYRTVTLNQFKAGEIKSTAQAEQPHHRKTEFYNDYVIPQDKPHALATFLIKDNNHTLMFAAQRGKCAGELDEEQARLIGILTPHLIRAVQIHRKISSATAEKKYALGALDQLRMSVILTNSLGRPLFVNRAAERMLAPSQGALPGHAHPAGDFHMLGYFCCVGLCCRIPLQARQLATVTTTCGYPVWSHSCGSEAGRQAGHIQERRAGG